MKLLYWLSYIPTAPLYALSWVLYAASRVLCWTGDVIHDQTTYRAWSVLHARNCAELQKQRAK